MSIPPFIVFPGKRMIPELLKGATTGYDGCVSTSGKGYSNTDIFSQYVKSHFLKYVQRRDPKQYIILIYDGHRSHISLGLIESAKLNKIILFVLPPHTSHILQPMDVRCFGPFEVLYQSEVKKFTRQTCDNSVTRYDICSLICKAYDKALQTDNLRAAFRRTGIYPFARNSVSEELLMPSLVYKGKIHITNENSPKENEEKSGKNGNSNRNITTQSKNEHINNFFKKKCGDILTNKVRNEERN